MKLALKIILIILITIVGIQLYKLYKQKLSLEQSVSKLTADIENLTKENIQLKSDMEYFSDPANLEKELKSRLNLKKPDEKLIIVIPPKTD